MTFATTTDPARLIEETPGQVLSRFYETISLTLGADTAAGDRFDHSHDPFDWLDIQELVVAHLATAGASCDCARLGLEAEVACRVRRLLVVADEHRRHRGTGWPAPTPDCSRMARLIGLGNLVAEHRGVYLPQLPLPEWTPEQWALTIAAIWGWEEAPDRDVCVGGSERRRIVRTLDRVVESWACTDELGEHNPAIPPSDPPGITSLDELPSEGGIDPDVFLATQGEIVLGTPAEADLKALVRLAHTVGESWAGAEHRWLAALELALYGEFAVAGRAWHDRRTMRCNDSVIDALAEALA